MYSPALREKTTKTIYRLKRFYRKPMTEITEQLIQKSLSKVEKELVCRICIGERNNQCDECCLNERNEPCGTNQQ